MAAVDLGTRLWWRMVGRPVDLAGQEAWLDAPISSTSAVGSSWLDHVSGLRPDPRVDAGLLTSLDVLSGPDFDPTGVHPLIRDFYERTSRWTIDVWSQWSPLFRPGGALVTGLFGRRVQQLALPVDPLATSRGMASDVTPLLDGDGVQRAAAWIRTLKSTGDLVFSGCYGPTSLPDDPQPRIHVSFPLESGNLQVFLTPVAHADGSFSLISGPDNFGRPGTYVVVALGGRHFAARVPLHERFHLFVDGEGILRTDHELRLGHPTALRLHYRMTRAPE